MIGRVVSTKLTKTATVLVERTKIHPLYKKSFKRSKKYLVQDDLGVKLGDVVDLEKIAPKSKNKHWQITKVVGRDVEAIISEELKVKAQEAIEEVMPEEKEKSTADSQQSTDKEGEVKEEKKTIRKRKDKKSDS